jgi:signal transduction histidine kinase
VRCREALRFDTPVRVAGERVVIVDFQLAPLRDEDGQITHIVASGVPVDERIAAEQQLRSLNRSLEQRVAEEVERREAAMSALVQSQKLDALGQLTAGIAHDFNNVVAAISGGFHLVQKWSRQDKVKEVARLGADAAKRGSELVKHLLAFARQQVLAPRSVDLHELIENIMPLIAQSLGRGITLKVDCPADIGMVLVDPVQLETALINLAVNARDAMPGGGDLLIAGCPAHDGEAIAITVRDTGEGMSPEVLSRALEPFFTTKEQGKGTGLGLAMVHGFARQSGGALAVESRVGHGTSVTLTLPRAVEAQGDAAPAEAVDQPGPAHGRAILLIDDDDLVRTVTSHQLQDMGHRVVEASSGDMAISLLADDCDVDLVLCDVVMPRESGPAVAARIRKLWPGTPIVFMTGHANRDQLKGEAILDKPFTPRQLAEHLERWT